MNIGRRKVLKYKAMFHCGSITAIYFSEKVLSCMSQLKNKMD